MLAAIGGYHNTVLSGEARTPTGSSRPEACDAMQSIVIKGKGAWLALRSFEQVSLGAGVVGPAPKGQKRQKGPGQRTMRERLKFLFRLSAGIEQDPDPRVLPSDEEILNTAVEAAGEAVK